MTCAFHYNSKTDDGHLFKDSWTGQIVIPRRDVRGGALQQVGIGQGPQQGRGEVASGRNEGAMRHGDMESGDGW